MMSFLRKSAKKMFAGIVTFDLISLLTTKHVMFIFQWFTGVYKETFNVKKITQTMQNIWNFIVRESSLQEMANFGDYLGDFRL